MPPDDLLCELAERQWGLATRVQFRAAGLSSHATEHRLERDDWSEVSHRVLRRRGSPHLLLQRMLAAVFDAGPNARLPQRGASLWKLPGFVVDEMDVLRVYGDAGHVPTLARLHQTRALPAHHLAEVCGIPTITLPRLLFDLAPTLPSGRLERLVDSVTAKSPGVLTSLHRLLDEIGHPRRPGTKQIRKLLEARPIGYIPVASGLERRFEAILTAAGEAPLIRQVDLGGHEWVGRVDFLDRDLLLTAEVDSILHHSSLTDQAAEARRDERLLAAGYRKVLRIPRNSSGTTLTRSSAAFGSPAANSVKLRDEARLRLWGQLSLRHRAQPP